VVAAAVPEPPPRRILGIFPNHNASPCLSPYVPISTKDKFKIASEDAFDPGAIVLAALTGGASQLFNSNRPFGQEASGYGRYVSAAYANHVIGGRTAFNYSRVLGASSTVAISSLYYANHRDAAASAIGFGVRLGGTMAANILKEFWPDLSRKLPRKH
jgi:hypothetical protein